MARRSKAWDKDTFKVYYIYKKVAGVSDLDKKFLCAGLHAR